MPTFRVEQGTCPTCSKPLDSCTNTTDNGEPEEGDFSICLYCATILKFNADLSLRKATAEEIYEFDRIQPELCGLLMQTREQVIRLKESRNASTDNRTGN